MKHGGSAFFPTVSPMFCFDYETTPEKQSSRSADFFIEIAVLFADSRSWHGNCMYKNSTFSCSGVERKAPGE
jgi:hypothetical protein